jgi:hypothetical protein
MPRRTHENTLSVRWSKRERDFLYYFPSSKSDGGYLHSRFQHDKDYNGKTLAEELRDRGYDVKTLRFSIMKDPDHPRWKKE